MLRKHIVLESSCFANLQYDIQMLFGVMESVSVEDDICSYIELVREEELRQKFALAEEEMRNVEGASKVLHEDSEELLPPPTATTTDTEDGKEVTEEVDHAGEKLARLAPVGILILTH